MTAYYSFILGTNADPAERCLALGEILPYTDIQTATASAKYSCKITIDTDDIDRAKDKFIRLFFENKL